MKITRLGPVRAVSTTSTLGGGGGGIDGGTGTGGSTMPPGSGTVPTATGSNTWAWGSNVGAITANGSNAVTGPFVNFNGGTGVTISVSSNTLTFAASGSGGSGSSLPWFDVKQTYGAVADGTTDDTTAIQNAINAAAAAGGGVVYFRAGVYKVGGALTDTSRSNSQLTLPSVNYVAGEQIAIHLLGEFPPPPIFSVVGAAPLPDEHVVIKGTLTSVSGTSPSLLGGWGPDTAEDFTFILARIENIAFRLPEDPVYSALNLSHVAGVDLDNVVADVSDYQIQGITEPTTAASTGIILPGLNNGAYTRLGVVNVAGYYTGIRAGEHTYGQDVATWGCKVGLETVAGYHAIHFDRLMTVHCERGIKATGGIAYLSIDQYNTEHAASGWWVTDFDVDDGSNFLKGRVEWKVTLAGVGHSSTWTVNGATNLLQNEMGTATGVTYATPAIVLGTAAATGAAASVIRSDSTIVAFDATVPTTAAFGDSAATGSVAFAARRDHVHGMPADPGTSSGGHAHVVSEAHLSNGSATTYTLDQYFEPGSVIAWNTTTLARLGVTETLPDQATVSAAGTTGDTIQFDYAATLS